MPKVYWLIRALRGLKASLADVVAAHPSDTEFERRRNRLNDELVRTFPKADAIVVRNTLKGFRQKCNAQTLLVEVIPKTNPKLRTGCICSPGSIAHIVKIGDASALRKELAGWERTKPPSTAVTATREARSRIPWYTTMRIRPSAPAMS